MGKINWNTEGKYTQNYKTSEMDKLLSPSDYNNGDYNPSAGFDWTPYNQDDGYLPTPLQDTTDNNSNNMPTPSIWDRMRSFDEKLNNGTEDFIKNHAVTNFLARAGHSAADIMTGGQAIQNNYDTGSWLVNGIADLGGIAAGMVTKLPGADFSTGNALNKVIGQPTENALKDEVFNRFGIPDKLANLASDTSSKVGKYALNNLADYTIKGLSSGAELGAYNGATNYINGQDVNKGIAQGMGQGILLGTGSKAVGDAFSHFVPGIGKVNPVGEDGNNVIIQDEQGNQTPMNKTIFNTTAQKIPRQTIDNINSSDNLKGYSPQELNATKNFNNDLIGAREYGATNNADSLEFNPEDANNTINNELKSRLGANGGTTYTVKNTVKDQAMQDYEDAMNTIGNHFGTNKLTPEEVARIKPELGIDVQQLLSNIDNAKTDVGAIGDRQRLRQVANVDNTVFHPSSDGFGVPQDTKYPNQKIPSLINPKKATVDVNGEGNTNIPLDENAQQMPSISDVIKSRTKQPVNDVLNTDYSKVNDIDTLNNHISQLQDTIKNTNDESQLKAMNLQLFSAQAQLKKLTDVVRPNIDTPGSRIVSSNDSNKFNFKNALNNFYTKTVDINKPIADMSKVSGDNAYIKSINSKNVGGIVDHILQDGLVDRQGNKIGFSLKDIAKQIPKGKENEFWEYMLHKHNVQRAAEGKNVYSDYDSAASQDAVNEYEKLNPDLKKAGQNVTKFLNKFMSEWGNKSGLISDDLWSSLQKQYPNYIPTNRSFTELEGGISKTNGKGFVDQSTPLSKATGSSRDIINPVENIMNLVNRTVRTAKYNEVGQEILNSLRKDPTGLQKYAEIVPEGTEISPSVKNVVTVFRKRK